MAGLVELNVSQVFVNFLKVGVRSMHLYRVASGQISNSCKGVGLEIL